MATPKVVLGQIEAGNYTLTVVAPTEAEARKALTAEYKRALKNGARAHPWPTAAAVRNFGDANALDYLGARFTLLEHGKVSWEA